MLADEVARSVMEARQKGVVMADLIALVDTSHDATVSEIFKRVIQLAYAEPLYSTEEYKLRAITEFRNTIFKDCLENFQGE